MHLSIRVIFLDFNVGIVHAGSREREWYACMYMLLLNMVFGPRIAL
jgi:hypothetical protein